MQRLGKNTMLNFSQNTISNDGSYTMEQGWFYDPGSSSFGGRGRTSSAKSFCKSHGKEHREAEKSLSKVRKEWMKVKQEMGYAKLCGEHLSETVEETNKKIASMLAELDRTDKYMQDLIAQNEQEQEYC